MTPLTPEQARKHMDALAPYVLPKGEEHWEPVYAYLEHLIAENATLRQQAAQLAEAQAREARLREDLQRERLSHSNTIDQRDHAQEAADRLAYALFDIDEIGEHSSANCPWANAAERLEALKGATND